MQVRAAGQRPCASFLAAVRQRTASMITTSRRASAHGTASPFAPARRPQASMDDLALPRRVQLAQAPSRRSLSTAAVTLTPFRKINLSLQDGTPASIVSMDLLADGQDRDDLAAFYKGLSSFSGIKGDRCSDRDAGGSSNIAFHAPRQMEIAQECVRDGGRVLALRAEVKGRSVIVGACMMDYSDDGDASPHRMVTADAFRGQGIASMLKLAQLECAIADGRTGVRRFFDVEPPVLRAYVRACERLGLTLSMWPSGGFRIALIAASSTGGAAGAAHTTP